MGRVLGTGTTRKLFLAAIAVGLAATPGSARARLDCTMHDEWNGLFCDNGNQIMYCDNAGGEYCYVGCGEGNVEVTCEGAN